MHYVREGSKLTRGKQQWEWLVHVKWGSFTWCANLPTSR